MAKRKEIDEAMEEFSNPAFKIRRLEPKLPPIEEVPFPFGGVRDERTSEMAYTMDETVPLSSDMPYRMDETVSPSSSADDRAIVLYTPSDPLLNVGPVPPNPSILISPQLLKSLKNHMLHHGSSHNMEDKSRAGNECLAVVPWVPPVSATMASYWSSSQQDQDPVAIEEPMESEDDSLMEVENEPVGAHDASNLGGNGGSEGFHPQWQLHCMTPGTPPNSTSHLMWSQ
ncbi:DBH-like monooxygenase [Rhynchospora pubera]|uniref:DBH-like monooxygenase n=1 Tax=Rhynchospora pubera TaxID=906938 RepID=A0AAV8DBF6_9POAL|nr:DBH-like monooxygenase [Rhynchospora pubera]